MTNSDDGRGFEDILYIFSNIIFFWGGECTSGQVCPGDNLCHGACTGMGLGVYVTCEESWKELFDINQCGCADGSEPCAGT